MKIGLVLACVLVLSFHTLAEAQVRVRGYVKKDGTYVAPHYRSSPNSTKSDNYSSRGNYNPYTGKVGTANPYPDPGYQATVSNTPSVLQSGSQALEWKRYQAQPAISPRHPAPRPITYAPSALQPTATYSVYRCEDAQGNRHYLSYPRAGCDEIRAVYSRQAAAPQKLVTYRGYTCSSDCSGHEAGYSWAEDHGIEDPDDCGGNSQSFIEGCEAYAEEQQDETE